MKSWKRLALSQKILWHLCHRTSLADVEAPHNTKAVTVLGYLAQLLTLPAWVRKQEPTVISRLLHAPHNMLGPDLPFKLNEVGCLPFTSIHSYTLATLFRAFHKTIQGWEDMVDALQANAQEFLPAVQVFEGLLSPEHWDSTPMVMNLFEAKLKFKNMPRHGQRLTEALQNPLGHLKLQSKAYKCILPAVHPGNTSNVIVGRLCRMLPQCELQLKSIDIAPALEELRRLRKSHVAMCILKTWCNGWITSERMHRDVRHTCIFGCRGEKDNLRHYVSCNRLWNPIFERMRIPQTEDKLRRLAIIGTERNCVLAVAIAFTVYHSSRGETLPIAPSKIQDAVKAADLWLS